ncbi:MAG: hypothetical protein WD876_02210 [Candidatus Pacearchaeota archaeon]
MICQKGNHEIESDWKSRETYRGIDRHHNPPEFMFKDTKKEKWTGEMLDICRKHHIELHKEIKKIMYRNSNSLKFINSEDWLMKKMSSEQIVRARKEVYIFTKEWLKQKDDTNTT